MPALLYWPFSHWGEGCSLSSSSVEISVSFWVTATWCQSALIWLLRPADYNLISGALKINLCRAFCDRGCVGAGSLITRVYFFVPVRFYSAWTKFQLPFPMMKQAVMGVLDVEALKILSSSPLSWESPSFWILYQNSASVFLPYSEEDRVGCGKTKSEVTFMGLFVLGMVHMPVIPGEAKGGGVWVPLIRLSGTARVWVCRSGENFPTVCCALGSIHIIPQKKKKKLKEKSKNDIGAKLEQAVYQVGSLLVFIALSPIHNPGFWSFT